MGDESHSSYLAPPQFSSGSISPRSSQSFPSGSLPPFSQNRRPSLQSPLQNDFIPGDEEVAGKRKEGAKSDNSGKGKMMKRASNMSGGGGGPSEFLLRQQAKKAAKAGRPSLFITSENSSCSSSNISCDIQSFLGSESEEGSVLGDDRTEASHRFYLSSSTPRTPSFLQRLNGVATSINSKGRLFIAILGASDLGFLSLWALFSFSYIFPPKSERFQLLRECRI
jgi:hypothetical protein